MKKTLVVLCFALTSLIAPSEGESASNSVVRFRFSYGATRYGDVDVELFDQDKPVTVSNFLAYVQSSRYDNSLVNRCIPGFVVQGGEYTMANPFSAAPFELITKIPTFGNITNEFNVGTVRSNVFGTLAMSKVDPIFPGGGPNSASSSWFFNLADNSTNLNNQNGGFTVFGEVKAGQNVLKAFNSFSENKGIINMERCEFFNCFYPANCAPLYSAGDTNPIAFPELPVGFLGQDCVNYSDAFTVQIIELITPDVTGPRITIAAPAANGTVTNNNRAVHVNGAATDNVSIANVRVYLNAEAPVVAAGSNAWSLTLSNVPPGTNTIVVEASDLTGNRTRLARSFFHSVRVPLTLHTVGAGTTTGPTNTQLLELTRPYTLTAKPAAGSLFGVWTGAFNEASASLTFNMESNLSFTAVFFTNLFPYVKGVYNGLFHDPDLVEQRSSGFLTLTLGDFGGYSGKLLMNGRSFRLSGSFGVDGGETNTVLLSEFDNIRLLMHVALTGGSNQITGSVTNRNWTSDLRLDRPANPGSLAGNYTFILPVDTNAVPGPEGESYGTLKVDARGGVSLRGVLADNTPLSLRSTLSKDGALPLYAPLYKGLGALVSWVMFDTNRPVTDFNGLVNWFKQSQVYAKHYARGFTNEMTLLGSRYITPTTNRVLQLTSATVGFTNGNLAADFANGLTLGPDNRITPNGGTNKLTLTVTKPSGLLSGTILPPTGTRSLPFKGAVLQKQNRGAGFLAGSNRTTQVRLDAAP